MRETVIGRTSTKATSLTVGLLFLVASCEFDSITLGKRIYQYGQGAEGYLEYQQGPDWLAQARRGCETCHGPMGRGRSVKVGKVTGAAPPVTRSALVERGYDAATLRRAITKGLDITGRPMNWYMPRWQLSEKDMQALLRYLGTF